MYVHCDTEVNCISANDSQPSEVISSSRNVQTTMKQESQLNSDLNLTPPKAGEENLSMKSVEEIFFFGGPAFSHKKLKDKDSSKEGKKSQKNGTSRKQAKKQKLASINRINIV